jgi:hypothetical protein
MNINVSYDGIEAFKNFFRGTVSRKVWWMNGFWGHMFKKKLAIGDIIQERFGGWTETQGQKKLSR